MVVLAPAVALAQRTTSVQVDTTQIAALIRYPAFFHNRTVVVQGTVKIVGSETWLEASADARIRLVRLTVGGTGKALQVRGTFIDVGRLHANDPRLAALGLDTLMTSGGRREWPRPGGLLVLSAERAAIHALRSGRASIHDVAVDPERFQNQAVVVVGQFRGRNLVGDQPALPGHDKWEFVLRNGTSSIWVVGRRPQGPDFDLNPAAPKDVGRWLRVGGVVRRQKDLVYLEADAIERGESEPETGPAERAAPLPALPPPEITFSLPIEDDTDVSLKGVVRVQFSRVMDAESFVGKVRASYLGTGPADAAPVRDPDLVATYMPKDQVLVISFPRPLERFRRLRIELLNGICTPDGSPLKPWSVTFTTGGR